MNRPGTRCSTASKTSSSNKAGSLLGNHWGTAPGSSRPRLVAGRLLFRVQGVGEAGLGRHARGFTVVAYVKAFTACRRTRTSVGCNDPMTRRVVPGLMEKYCRAQGRRTVRPRSNFVGRSRPALVMPEGEPTRNSPLWSLSVFLLVPNATSMEARLVRMSMKTRRTIAGRGLGPGLPGMSS